jgi:hypothetical protein
MHFTTEPHETAEGRRIILVLVNRLRIEGTFEFVKLEPAEGNAFTAEPHETAEGRRILVLVNRLRIEGTFEFVKLRPRRKIHSPQSP